MSKSVAWRLMAACSIGVFAVSFATESAHASDIEERIAELEATTAHKGNRKVSLTVSGWINEAIFFWDDGVEKNTYVGTNELEQNRFRVLGDAKIGDGWSAGYIIEAGINGAGSKSFSQTSSGTTIITTRKAAWFLKSKTWGKVTLGRYDTATYHLLDNVDSSITRYVSDYEAAGTAVAAFRIRRNGAFVGTTRWAQLMTGFNNASAAQSGLRNVARYDSPEIAGITLAASWGSDDEAEVALFRKGSAGDVKYQASIGYGVSTDPKANAGDCAFGGTGDCRWWGAGIFASHVPTGLFLYLGYGANEIELAPANAAREDLSQTFYIQGGIERSWLPLGPTNIFAEYRKDETGFLGAIGNGAELDMWAAGIVQQVAAAEMALYAVYRHFDGELTSAAGITAGVDSFDMLITGAKINF